MFVSLVIWERETLRDFWVQSLDTVGFYLHKPNPTEATLPDRPNKIQCSWWGAWGKESRYF